MTLCVCLLQPDAVYAAAITALETNSEPAAYHIVAARAALLRGDTTEAADFVALASQRAPLSLAVCELHADVLAAGS